jgi:hypothetical protein
MAARIGEAPRTGVLRHPYGPRLYLGGVRVHHGAAGLCLLGAGALAHSRALLALGTALVVHDRRDFPFRDSDNHVPRHLAAGRRS